MSVSNAIEIKNARVNNLKGIDVQVPRNKFVVITGVSGSGKSSLAFDTLYAEGQRRYVESLNTYARQFLGQNNKPEVDYIKGIPPAIAIEQKVNTRNSRSTVGTATEIYDYLKLLFARIGRTISPISGKEVKRDTVDDVVTFISSQVADTKVVILTEIPKLEGTEAKNFLLSLSQQGFSRIERDGEFLRIDNTVIDGISSTTGVHLVIDRVSTNDDPNMLTRLADSVSTAFYEGNGVMIVRIMGDNRTFTDTVFSDKFEADGIIFEQPTEQLFTFNSPIGACETCEGFGKIIGIDEDLVVPDKTKSVAEDAVACWNGPKMGEWKIDFLRYAQRYKFPAHTAYCDLTAEQKELLWHGRDGVPCIDEFFRFVKSQQHKIQYRVIESRFRGKTTCPVCKGRRLKRSAEYVKICGKSITDLVEMPISDLSKWINSIALNENEEKIAEKILVEIKNRLEFLIGVGLEYLTLNRTSSTLSGGESQRINIATSLGSSLVGSLYILDEPSIGLHSRDTQKLIAMLRKLRDIGNTVVVVEHDEEIIRSADYIIDIGPEAGRKGGEVVYCGDFDKMQDADTLTIKYLNGTLKIDTPTSRRAWNRSVKLSGVCQNNLKNISVEFPLNVLTVVTGVSGSGKSTLVNDVLYPALARELGINTGDRAGNFREITGDISTIKNIEFIDQNPIGKSTRSNPVTYIKAFDEIRKLFANQQLAKQNGYTATHFSFNAQGGRCDACNGEGIVRIEMQFMADIELKCEHCNGKRFKDEILEVRYREKNISDILEMTINQAIEFFGASDGTTEQRILQRIKPLQDVGLGYVRLGQASSTLSGGESQRVKLASFIADESSSPTLFIFDEPTTGLHFHDIKKLMKSFDTLIEHGHSLVVIEHNMDVIKCADWVIDLGPEGGTNGGNVVVCGRPEDVAKCKNSYTGQYLKSYL